jgi:predicted ArsR family transcriptional regulator
LKWAFCDLDTQSAHTDVYTLSEKDIETVTELLPVRAIQFCLFVRALVGQDAMNQIMQNALKLANDSSTPAPRK